MLSIIQAAGWPIWPLILCSILAVALILERLFQLQTNKVFPPKVMEQAMEATRRGFPSEESLHQLESAGLLGPVLASGLRCLQKNPQASDEDVKTSMEMSGRIAAHHLERYLPTLGTIASVAPLLGLLGTVVGMIEIFGASTPAANQPAQLAHGISVALYNTAFGLIVAIPTLMFWRYFRGIADRHLLALEVSAERFARHVVQLRN
ncbi:MotA/TolQ/ExbB proton channel family protein [Limnohabitans lacus]|uniref:MotA/TolQ/ExbB proton channel family protein n=1 Tax=Limnohabitans lacus TaxID=3045173 RepID=A0ABT6X5X4_9BURK|nr:MotA/TolQ/ExbB proton channel family protein [Limnohabitans sp. HM2-2]MDI9233388.1 MotA/TolQ/ExbB proton channel family protein [Limnohabitans sp. HM2-2]